MKPLFTLEEIQQHKPGTANQCKTCHYCERWECGSRNIFYCGTRKSKRTNNGLLKIKAKQDACAIYANAANI